jgi:plasmid stabilization system protein ParE
MDFTIIWSDADFEDIWTFIAEHDAEAATRIGRDILAHIRELKRLRLLESATYRFHITHDALIATDAVDRCTLLHAAT